MNFNRHLRWRALTVTLEIFQKISNISQFIIFLLVHIHIGCAFLHKFRNTLILLLALSAKKLYLLIHKCHLFIYLQSVHFKIHLFLSKFRFCTFNFDCQIVLMRLYNFFQVFNLLFIVLSYLSFLQLAILKKRF